MSDAVAPSVVRSLLFLPLLVVVTVPCDLGAAPRAEPPSDIPWFRDPVLAVSPDGRVVITSDSRLPDPKRPGRLVLWDATTGAPAKVLSVPGQPQCVQYSPDGKRIAVRVGGLPDGKQRIVVVSATDGAVEFESTALPTSAKTPQGAIWQSGYGHFAFTADGKGLLTLEQTEKTTPDSSRLVRWDLVKKTSVTERLLPFRRGIFSADGSRVAIEEPSTPGGPVERAWQIFDTDSGKVLATTKGKVYLGDATFDKSANRLLTVDTRGEVHLWDAKTGSLLREIKPANESGNLDLHLDITDDERKQLKDAARELERAFGVEAFRELTTSANRDMKNGFLSPDGKTVTLISESAMHFVNADTGKTTGIRLLGATKLDGFYPNLNEVNFLFAPDGSRVMCQMRRNAVPKHPGGLAILDVRTGKLIHSLTPAKAREAISGAK